MSSRGSFESICAVYEATLRFLSLSYELVANAYLDITESSVSASSKGNMAMELYNEMVAVFFLVSAPFSNYQQRFDQLELKYSKVATQLVSKDIQQAVGSVSSSATAASRETLQDATERLKDLAPFIFPMMEGSLDRFELLNGGYRATEALTTIDGILSCHTGEIVIAIRTLSAAMTSDANRLAENFDEQYVLCAMEVLKIAGSFRRDLRTLEEKTRDRLGKLSDRMESYLAQEGRFQEMTSKTKNVFVLPDSLSMVEIDSILIKATCSKDEDEEHTNTSLAVLQRLTLVETDRAPVTLYPETEEAIKRLASSCHSFVFDVCSSVPRKHLSGISSMAVWHEGTDAGSSSSYGTLPQQYITHVGEHMLALVQALEPFASDPEALSLANEVMGGVRDVALHAWSEFVAAAGLIGSEAVIESLMNGKDITDLVLSNAALNEEDAALEEGAGEAERKIAVFCNLWLDLLGLDVTGRLLERIMRIPQLTSKGCEHLSIDLNYLVNVFSALGVAGHPHPLVSHLAELTVQNDADLMALVASRNRSNAVEGALRAVEVRVALLRGIIVD
jgi:conserved oligomeric Golgi complex subunit 7